jgi:hypothetical protein
MLKAPIGDLCATAAQKRVITVNCFGIMGKGVAQELKIDTRRYLSPRLRNSHDGLAWGGRARAEDEGEQRGGGGEDEKAGAGGSGFVHFC